MEQGLGRGMFAVTNVDGIVALALFFSRATGRGGAARLVIGPYAGFGALLAASVVGALLAASVVGALGAALIPYLGLLPLLLGVRGGERVARRTTDSEDRQP